MSKDPNEEYFSDGVSVQILNELSGVEGFKVTSQRSSFAFKEQNKSLQEIAALLDIQYVIDGSVFRDGDRIRITAQLVDAVDDQNIWTETYNEQAEDLFRVQDDIAKSITGRLRQDGLVQEVAGAEPESMSFDAYDLYLQGSEHARKGRFVEAAELLDRVLQREPNFVAALALRAKVELLMSDVFFGAKLKPVKEVLPAADRWLTSAETIDAHAPDVLAGRGLYLEIASNNVEISDPQSDAYMRDREESERLYREALRLRPNSTEVREHLSRSLGAVGRGAEAIEQLKVALTYDPVKPVLNISLFNWAIMQHDLELALGTLDRWRELSPDNPAQQMHRARYLRFAGELAESFEALEALEAIASPRQLEILSEPLGEVLLALGEYERAASVTRNDPKYSIRALTLQGRYGEAVLAARRWERQEPGLVWPIDELLRALYFARRWDEFVDLFEQNPEKITMFREYHYFSMVYMAYAPYLETGHHRAEDIWTLVESGLQGDEPFGPGKPEADLMLARVYTIVGREEEAVAALEEAVNKFLYTPRIAVDPVFARLSERSDYQGLLDRIENKINAERAELGLPPTQLLRRSAAEGI